MADKEHEQATPEISVIIPIYNRESFIQPLVQCLKNQTLGDFECIIIDDGSTDQTGKLCDSLTTGDERFIVKHTPNFGVSHARNVALDIARGEYITFVDSDDSIPEDYLDKLLNRIKDKQVDMVIGSFCRVYADGSREKTNSQFEDRVYLFDELMTDFARYQKESGVFGRCWGKLFSRDLASGIYFDESLKLAEDFDYYLKVYPRVKTVCFDNTCEYGYYAGAENSSVQVDDDDIDYIAQLRISIRYKEFLENAGVFTSENERIVSEQILNYAFFAVFHSKSESFHVVFQTVCELTDFSGVQYKKMSGLKGIILKSIFSKNEVTASAIMKAYHAARKALRGH